MTDEDWAREQAEFVAKPPPEWRYCGYISSEGALIRVDDPAEGVETHKTFGCSAHEEA